VSADPRVSEGRAGTAPPSPALMLRSGAAHANLLTRALSPTLRGVSKHEGAPTDFVLILRDARTRLRVGGTVSHARPQDEDERRINHSSQCQTASFLRSRGAFLRPGFCTSLLRSHLS